MTNTADTADSAGRLVELGSALAGVFGFDDPARWGDEDLLTITGAVEAVGRVVDAHRVAVAGEIAERSGQSSATAASPHARAAVPRPNSSNGSRRSRDSKPVAGWRPAPPPAPAPA